MKLFSKISNLIRRIEWRLYKELKRLRLKNRQPTIIASNCVGTYIYYDMKMRFNSPTINLSFDMNDYVRFLENLPWYLGQPVVPCVDERFDYPRGMIGDVEIRFNHYKTFDEAVAKWNERKQRIDWDNLFVFGVDCDNCTYDSIRRFDALPYPHKVIFTHKPYPEFSSAYYLPGFEGKNCVGVVTNFIDQFRIRRYLDCFDYIAFLNKSIAK